MLINFVTFANTANNSQFVLTINMSIWKIVGFIAAVVNLLTISLAIVASVLSILHLLKGDGLSSATSPLKLIYKNSDANSNIQSIYLNSTGKGLKGGH